MKKWMILAAAVVLAAPVFAQTQEAFPSYIQVNGRSQMEVTPDEFYLSIVINERESKGKITVETQQRQMIDALKKLGVERFLQEGQLADHRQIPVAAPFGGRSR